MILNTSNKSASAPIIEIVIVTYNRKADLLDQLRLLMHLDYPKESYGITIVNNCSNDDTASAVDEFIAHNEDSKISIRALNLPENIGGSGGFSKGIGAAISQNSADYIWLLDDDATPQENTLKRLVGGAEREASKSIIGGVILDKSNVEKVTEAGAKVRWWKARQELLFSGEKVNNLPEERFESEYASAACMLIPMAAAKELQGFANFFLHFDDVEWCLRAKKAGYKTLIEPQARVAHPTKKELYRPGIKYYDVRNFLYVAARHYSIATPYLFIRFLVKATICSLSHRKRNESLETFKALFDFMTKTQGKLQ
ncbi:glycosyltransferase family 2 protein [Microbulbifer sp. A4B17]|uniref:glycosyltransferase family 2 protein n=1 Tax=Microbulbifer sp. A4B17 TaxID=359370 RepID=UPI0013004E94|nr:glycosyltransferase [Microbulbifer sp. A4B17]